MEKSDLEKVWPVQHANGHCDKVFYNDDNDPLCCCEYYDRYNERYHILECCCNCIDFDESAERFISCRPVEQKYFKGMLLTFQDRLRIPWSGGAKQISSDGIIPFFGVPIIFLLAPINFYTAITVGFLTCCYLGYRYHTIKQQKNHRSKFLMLWIFCSIIAMIIVFETTVPLLEILPEENFTLILFTLLAMFCLMKTKSKSKQNIVVQSLASEDDLPDITEEQITVLIDNEENQNSNICQDCRKYVAPRTFHCYACQSCIKKRDHHSYWLDCCIGSSNHRYYYFGLLFAEAALILGMNLTLTSVCHPLLVFTVFGVHILIPDDCSEVFDQFELGIAFVSAVYAGAIAVYLFIVIFKQNYLIAKGITQSEWQTGEKIGNRQSIFWNFRSFLIWRHQI